MTGWRIGGALALGLVPAVAAAQSPTPAPPRFDGEVAASDPADAQGRRYDEYVFDLARDQRVIVTGKPTPRSRLVPAIEIYGEDAARPLARDDSQGEGRNVRLLFTPPTAGLYRIRLIAGSGAAGRYVLTVEPPAAGGMLGGIGSVEQTAAIPTIVGPTSRFIICPGHPRCPR